MVRFLGILFLVAMGLLIFAGWLGTNRKSLVEEDTMKYKLKYVRLRPIHEENRLRILSGLTEMELEFRAAALRKELTFSAVFAKP